MKLISPKRICTRTLCTRLSENQFKHIKSQGKPSDYLRALIERDMTVVQDDNT